MVTAEAVGGGYFGNLGSGGGAFWELRVLSLSSAFIENERSPSSCLDFGRGKGKFEQLNHRRSGNNCSDVAWHIDTVN